MSESVFAAREAVKAAKRNRDTARARYEELVPELVAELKRAEQELDAAWVALNAALDERDASEGAA